MASPKLRIIGIKERVRWYKPEDGSEPSWSAAIGIEGLVPSLAPGGYKYKYTRELIASDGKVVNTGIISQAPGSKSTSTNVAIGKGLPEGDYTARVFGGGQEDTVIVHVPDISEYVDVPEIPKPRNILKRIIAPKLRTLKFVKELYVEKENGTPIIGLERPDETKYSVLLEDEHGVAILNDNELNKIMKILERLEDKLLIFAEEYSKDDRKEIEFLHDLVAMGKYISKLPSETDYLMNMGAPSDLMHNRIQAQLMAYYTDMGCNAPPRPVNFVNQNLKHDFNLANVRCDVKTIQSNGEIEHMALGGFRLSQKSFLCLTATIQNDIEKAQQQVGSQGMIFIAPWSYRINALLRKCFEGRLSLHPPPPTPNSTTLVLTTKKAFEDEYVTFNTAAVMSDLLATLDMMQALGVKNITQIPIREGLTMRTTTAPRAGSVAGYIFKV
jgi:hypothetical protein